jgi:hypothetical protein
LHRRPWNQFVLFRFQIEAEFAGFPNRERLRRLVMAANAIPTPELKVSTEQTTSESCVPVTLKQRFRKLLREVFEGHEEHLGVTPDS